MKAVLALSFLVTGLAFALIGRQMFKEGYDGMAAYGLAVIFTVLGIVIAVWVKT